MTLFWVEPNGPDAFQRCGFCFGVLSLPICDTFTRTPGTDHFSFNYEKYIVVSPEKMHTADVFGCSPIMKIC